MKVVFDTDVLIASFLTEGVCSKVFVRARKHEFQLVMSADIIGETEEVLRKKFKLLPSEISSVCALLKEAASEILHKIDPVSPIYRDPDDDKVLACASEANADYIVTGDEDLLVIKQYSRTVIVTPRDFEGFFAD